MNRFRVSTQLARKLAELGVPPADVLRHAGLPAGLFDQEKILVIDRGALRPLPGDRERQRRSGDRPPAGDGAARRALRPDRADRGLGALAAGRARAAGALQAAHLPRGAPRHGERRRMPGAVSLAARRGDGAAGPHRPLLRLGGGHRPPWHRRSGPAAAARAARAGPEPPHVRVALRLPGEVRGPRKHDRLRPGGPRSAVRHPQHRARRGPRRRSSRPSSPRRSPRERSASRSRAS